MRSGWWLLDTGMFDGALAGFIGLRMHRTMASSAFWSALAIQAPAAVCCIAGMLIKGYDILQMLVLFGLAATAVVLSTLGRVEIYFNAIADTDNWHSRHTTMVGLRFIAVALTLFVVALPLLFKIHLMHS
ncbi:hypothetical protein ODJ79_32825 [Actinoplanes sp. KI2]|uniref:hypothetical protein n=1 Tax=Actinoplanes sp. KI2 TaxID=2983315 RepID=UPI0021D57B96|nr:hypothetical protein [Actinoplanes sp. KI2]MCU7728521.1 hypothetical protein [Actinoplanes sp. KI2]